MPIVYAGNFNGAKLPITLPTDRDVISAALTADIPEQARVVIARNTLDLGVLWVSKACAHPRSVPLPPLSKSAHRNR